MALSLTPEMCVLALFAGAAVVALAVRPASSGPLRQFLLEGSLSAEGPEEPSVDIEVEPDGSVTLWRNGLTDMTSDDAVSLAVNIRGRDVEIIERTAPGRTSSSAAVAIDSACFHLDFFGEEHYSFVYKVDGATAAAFTLHCRPGARRHLPLRV